ncbi:hypothetical protein [Streptomyces sp. H39-S7]|uniref:hypothetical protein n=1 Tax=Streptomyces sp. H39-S7 TaxID=3004357 RepID=UPI0022AF6707|nr:hypothetical protein [Streptomyces sp. H39-S7]MCZ4119430.1 hypothetical protein [Streptomyces sp. H39-S7]
MLAHRLSTVRSADRVVVLEGGRVVQQGTPAELAAVPGRYRTLLSEAGAPAEPPTEPPADSPTPNRPVQEQS